MLQMSVKSGDGEQVLDLVEIPEFILVQFCEMILRHQDMRNQDARYMLRETVNALNVKAKEAAAGQDAYDRYSLKGAIARIEELLDQFDQE
jgi:hypothetical protein